MFQASRKMANLRNPNSNPAKRFGGELTIDATEFNKAMEQLAKMTGQDFSKVVKSEFGSILEKSIKSTKAAKSKLIDERYTWKAGEKPSQKLVGRLTIGGRPRNIKTIPEKIRKEGRMVVNPDWRLLQKKLKEEKKYAKDRKGLAKATWYKQARDIGMEVKVPKYVLKAYKHLGRSASRSIAKENKRKNYYIQVKNTARVPMVKEVGGYGAFKRAINGRQRFFETNLKKGVFLKASKMIEKYGFIVTQEAK
tara:strand:+ start:2536 stop:3288 length:753 start_codon:yes stop_codon:yes gene_type:complete